MRSLYTAATGMIAQQTNLDTISNNLSNVNTTGYKTERTEFKSLLYQTLQTKTTTANGANKPVGAQVGLGTKVAATMSNYTQGAREETEIPTDFALEGKGFFAVRGVDGQTYYTRNGNFFGIFRHFLKKFVPFFLILTLHPSFNPIIQVF